MKKRLLFDIDGTLSEGIKYIVERYNKRTGEHVTVKEINKYDYVSGDFDAKAEWDRMWHEEPELSLVFPPARLATEVLIDLEQDGFEIMAAPTRPENVMHLTEKWLRQHNFVVNGLFHVVGPKANIECDMLIDDNPLEIELFSRLTGKPAFLKRQPWNRNYYPWVYRLFKVYGRNIYIAGGLESAKHVAEELFLGAKTMVKNSDYSRRGKRLAAMEQFKQEFDQRVFYEMSLLKGGK